MVLFGGFSVSCGGVRYCIVLWIWKNEDWRRRGKTDVVNRELVYGGALYDDRGGVDFLGIFGAGIPSDGTAGISGHRGRKL